MSELKLWRKRHFLPLEFSEISMWKKISSKLRNKSFAISYLKSDREVLRSSVTDGLILFFSFDIYSVQRLEKKNFLFKM